MEYAKLGNTGLEVSRICLGCMSYGDPTRLNAEGEQRWAWVLREDEAKPFFKRAFDAGINFFDTANIYGAGSSEEITGRALRDVARREDYVLATKVWGPMSPKPNGKGLSRKAIFQELDASLKRLGTDYVDLYQIHRWDDGTPIEETLEALNDVVRAGKVRYIGASSMHAWQFAKALHLSEKNGWARFVSMQNHYNLIYREEEREMVGLCRDAGIGMIPWSPLARGRLAREAGEKPSTLRGEKDRFTKILYDKTLEADTHVIERVSALAKKRGVSNSQVALAWLLHKPAVVAPIIGATKLPHLDDAIAAASLKLTPEEIRPLEEPYVPHAVAGFS